VIHHEGTRNTKEDDREQMTRILPGAIPVAASNASRACWVYEKEMPFGRPETSVPIPSVPFVARITQAAND